MEGKKLRLAETEGEKECDNERQRDRQMKNQENVKKLYIYICIYIKYMHIDRARILSMWKGGRLAARLKRHFLKVVFNKNFEISFPILRKLEREFY